VAGRDGPQVQDDMRNSVFISHLLQASGPSHLGKRRTIRHSGGVARRLEGYWSYVYRLYLCMSDTKDDPGLPMAV
jgi:hypothetical protein